MLHPRPLLRRATWLSLDGPWHFAHDDAAACSHPSQVRFQRQIEVPYAPESLRSGVADTGFHTRHWYARRVALAALPGAGGRILLHFGAVDHDSTVWVNGQYAGSHRGGHSPFTLDVTGLLPPDAAECELAVLAQDDPLQMTQPRGKQGWLAEPHSIWYPRTSGIWRSVWLERVPPAFLQRLRFSADVSSWTLTLAAEVTGWVPGMSLVVTLRVGQQVIAHDRYGLQAAALVRQIGLADPGIDDARENWMWSPEHPQLIDARIELLAPDGSLVDAVDSYTAMRSVRVEDGHFMLNDRPYILRMVLDQGYWPDSLMTADSERLRAEVELIKRLGFNGARKHQKSEDPRWLYWADQLGLCVWAEMSSAYAFADSTVHLLSEEWRALVERDLSHPCVVAWVPMNESWGTPALPKDARQVDLVRALYHLTRALDGTRPVIGNDGWEMPCGDIVSIHDYSEEPDKLYRRYGSPEATARTLVRDRPGGGRRLLLPGFDVQGLPVMLTEFGGIATLLPGEAGWGYSVCDAGPPFAQRYAELMAAVHACEGLAGFCYTQLTDTFLEKNGLVTPDRAPKADLLALAAATRGRHGRTINPVLNPLGYNARWLRRFP